MTTTQRILANGRRPQGCDEWHAVMEANHPICPYHWMQCINNNPGAAVPIHNPTEMEDWVEALKASQP